jgi:hypothetical protein
MMAVTTFNSIFISPLLYYRAIFVTYYNMPGKLLSNLFILVLLSTPAVSQQVLKSKVRQRSTDVNLTSVNVVNHTQNKYNISDAGGNHRSSTPCSQ